MNERSKKVVMLARAMLRDGTAESTRSRRSVSFKILCLTTRAAAADSQAITPLSYQPIQPTNHDEKIELEALFFYAFHLKDTDEGTVRQQVSPKRVSPVLVTSSNRISACVPRPTKTCSIIMNYP